MMLSIRSSVAAVGSMVASLGSVLSIVNNANSHSISEEEQQYSVNNWWTQGSGEVKGHTDYDQGPCDADVLAGCVAAADVHFVDLDEVSYDTFITFTGNQTRLVLFYQPSFMDKFFFVESLSSSTSQLMPNADDDDNNTTRMTSSSLMTRLSSSKTASAVVEPVVGRVNCLENLSLCRWIQTSLGLQLLTVIPWNPQYPNHSQQLAADVKPLKDSSFTETRMKEYGNAASQCLWKRYGAGSKALTIRCARNLESYHNAMQQEQKEEVERLIQQGGRIAMILNAGIIMARLILIIALGLAGLKLLIKCMTRCCCFFNVALLFQNSVSLNKQERKAQLHQQMSFFYVAAMTIGLTNIFVPAVTMLIAGPIASASLIWLWYYELKCCTTTSCCSFGSVGGGGGDPKNVVLQNHEEAASDKEKEEVALLSEDVLVI